LIEEEKMGHGRVSTKVYFHYFKAYGFWNVAVFTPLLFFTIIGLNALANVYLAKWSSDATITNSTSSMKNLEIYGAFGIGGCEF
jgi:hypothetical protein